MKYWITMEQLKKKLNNQIPNLFASIDSIQKQFDSEITFTNLFHTTPLEISQIFFRQYEEFLLYKKISDGDDIQAYLNDLKYRVDDVIRMNAYKYKAMLEPFKLEYDPIANYDMKEKHIDSRDNSDYSDKTSGTLKTENSRSGSMVVKPNSADGISTTNYVVPYDESAIDTGNGTSIERETSKVVQKGGTETFYGTEANPYKSTSTTTPINYGTEHSYLNKVSSGDKALEDDFNHNSQTQIDKGSIHRWGNIGVTTTQQMLESEIQLKRNSVLKELFEDVKQDILLSVFPQL